MSNAPASASSNGALQIPAELTVYQVAQLRSEILQAFEQGAPAPLDLSGVTEIDAAGVQVLLVARREARARGVAIAFLNPSAAVREVFATLGLDKDL